MEGSKKMFGTSDEIEKTIQQFGMIVTILNRLYDFNPCSADGKRARHDAIAKMEQRRDENIDMTATLRARLEVETVEYLMNEHQD